MVPNMKQSKEWLGHRQQVSPRVKQTLHPRNVHPRNVVRNVVRMVGQRKD